MRTLLSLPVLLLLAMPHALAQRHVDDTGSASSASIDVHRDATPSQAVAAPAHGETEDTDAGSGDAPRSGFGQVMAVLTGLLQDAAQREATGRGDGFALDNPAIEISVTPVAGRTSLLRAPRDQDATGERQGAAREPRLAAGTPR